METITLLAAERRNHTMQNGRRKGKATEFNQLVAHKLFVP